MMWGATHPASNGSCEAGIVRCSKQSDDLLRAYVDSIRDHDSRLAGLSDVGDKWETSGSVKDEETELSPCSNGSLGWNRTNDQRINRMEQGETEVPGRKKSST